MDHKCPNCEIMKKKITLYDNFFHQMKMIEEDEIQILNNNLSDSIFIEKDNNGILHKKLKSNLTENFLIIEKGKNLSHLSQKEQYILNEQTNLHNYNQIQHYTDKIGVVGTILKKTISWGKWLAII